VGRPLRTRSGNKGLRAVPSGRGSRQHFHRRKGWHVLPLQPTEIVHSLLERREEMDDAGSGSERQPPDTTDRCGSPSAAGRCATSSPTTKAFGRCRTSPGASSLGRKCHRMTALGDMAARPLLGRTRPDCRRSQFDPALAGALSLRVRGNDVLDHNRYRVRAPPSRPMKIDDYAKHPGSSLRP
jgi:hypothetical protein